MPTTAESWAAIVEGIRADVPGLAFPDPYRVVRAVKTGSDTRSNDVMTDTVVETGHGLVKPPSTRPRETVVAGDRIVATAYQDVLLPFATSAVATDKLEVQRPDGTWRRFEIVKVTRAERAAAFAVASVEERG